MTLKQTKQRGFTIVELLIVVVVIAILAAITIVAYNGIQNRSNTAAARATANSVVKKIEAFNSVETHYPTETTAAAYTTALNGIDVSRLEGGINIVTSLSRENGRNSVQIENCDAGAGARVLFFDFSIGRASTEVMTVGNTTGTCTALS